MGGQMATKSTLFEMATNPVASMFSSVSFFEPSCFWVCDQAWATPSREGKWTVLMIAHEIYAYFKRECVGAGREHLHACYGRRVQLRA